MIRALDRESLRQQFDATRPYPHIVVDGLLEVGFAREVAASYPDYEAAARLGVQFKTVNEQRKIQICEPENFPAPVRALASAISSRSFLEDLEVITGIPHLLPDERFEGGGMHITGSGGRLDVHVDFNYQPELRFHRRLNILLYLNEQWLHGWGGELELWDREVKQVLRTVTPELNRCLIFETTDISYHGVRPVTAPSGVCRKSFAGYYYTREAPAHWTGVAHSTVFRARPSERIRGALLMPAEKTGRGLIRAARSAKRWIKGILRRRDD